MNQSAKEYMISEALNTPEGKEALKAAMTVPIKNSLNYQAIGRALLTVDELQYIDPYPAAQDDVKAYVRKWID